MREPPIATGTDSLCPCTTLVGWRTGGFADEFGLRLPGPWQADGDGGAHARPTVDVHRPAVQVDQGLRQREAQARSGVLARQGVVNLREGLPDMFDLSDGHSDAGIADADDEAIALDRKSTRLNSS